MSSSDRSYGLPTNSTNAPAHCCVATRPGLRGGQPGQRGLHLRVRLPGVRPRRSPRSVPAAASRPPGPRRSSGRPPPARSTRSCRCPAWCSPTRLSVTATLVAITQHSDTAKAPYASRFPRPPARLIRRSADRGQHDRDRHQPGQARRERRDGVPVLLPFRRRDALQPGLSRRQRWPRRLNRGGWLGHAGPFRGRVSRADYSAQSPSHRTRWSRCYTFRPVIGRGVMHDSALWAPRDREAVAATLEQRDRHRLEREQRRDVRLDRLAAHRERVDPADRLLGRRPARRAARCCAAVRR